MEAHPVLPISNIGPGSTASDFSSEPVSSGGQFTPIPGERVKPEGLLPPDIDFSETERNRLIRYLDAELSDCSIERTDLVAKWARLKKKYRTKFPELPKDWPIANASQITIPVIKIAVQTLGSRLFQTVMAADPLASVRTDMADFQPVVSDYEKFLADYNEDVVDIEDVLDTGVTECIKLGTAVFEVCHRHERRTFVDFANGKYNRTTKTVFNGPMVYHLPLEDFWIRAAYTDPQKAPWCGKEVRLTWSQIKDMARDGQLNKDEIDKIWRWPINLDTGSHPGSVPETITTDEELEKFKPQDRDLFSLFELCVRWDVDGDGLDEEIIVRFHWNSRTLLRAFYSGFKYGRRPYEVMRYIRMEHRFHGEGLAEMLEHLQEEISTQHNQRLDNATIANLKIILVARLIRGLSPGDRLWSGKIVRVSDVQRDVGTLSLGEIYPSTVQNEQIAQRYVQEVSGAGEVATGQAQPVSRTTATAQLSLLEELNRRFDKTLKGMRKTIKAIHQAESNLFVINGTGGLARVWLGDDRGARLESFLAMPYDYVDNVWSIRILATKSTVNREVEFQSSIAVMNLIIQNGQQMMAMVGQLAPQALGVVAHELVKAVRPVFRKVMQYADAQNVDEALSVLNVLERILPAPENMGGMGTPGAGGAEGVGSGTGPGVDTGAPSVGGAAVPPPGTPDLGRMELLLNSIRQNNSGVPGVARPGRNGR